MELSYIFRFSDYEVLCGAIRSERRKRIFKVAVWLAFAVNLLLAIIIWRSEGGSSRFYAAAPNLILAACVPLIKFWLVPFSQRVQLRKIGLEGKRISVMLSDDALRASQEDMESKISWGKIVRFSQLNTHAFVWINAVQAVVLPFDAFSSEAERDAFLSYIEARIKPAG